MLDWNDHVDYGVWRTPNGVEYHVQHWKGGLQACPVIKTEWAFKNLAFIPDFDTSREPDSDVPQNDLRLLLLGCLPVDPQARSYLSQPLLRMVDAINLQIPKKKEPMLNPEDVQNFGVWKTSTGDAVQIREHKGKMEVFQESGQKAGWYRAEERLMEEFLPLHGSTPLKGLDRLMASRLTPHDFVAQKLVEKWKENPAAFLEVVDTRRAASLVTKVTMKAKLLPAPAAVPEAEAAPQVAVPECVGHSGEFFNRFGVLMEAQLDESKNLQTRYPGGPWLTLAHFVPTQAAAHCMLEDLGFKTRCQVEKEKVKTPPKPMGEWTQRPSGFQDWHTCPVHRFELQGESLFRLQLLSDGIEPVRSPVGVGITPLVWLTENYRPHDALAWELYQRHQALRLLG